jgi:hypothetical protein
MANMKSETKKWKQREKMLNHSSMVGDKPEPTQAPSGQKKPDSKTGYGQNLEFSHKRKLFVAQQQTI